MISLKEIKASYPTDLQNRDRFILREYLQYKILEAIYGSPFANKLVFLGGTCLRIIHQNERFSEDIDFDNLGLTPEQFDELTVFISDKLVLEGFQLEFRNVKKGAFHCYMKFPAILHEQGLSGHMEEKILIQLDTEPQGYTYIPELVFLNRFDVFTQIACAPLSLLLAQKFYTILNRPRNKGRDFLDIVFILSKNIKPDYKYLAQKAGILNATDLKQRVISHCSTLDMNEMAKDVAPFLFKPSAIQKVLRFPEIISSNILE